MKECSKCGKENAEVFTFTIDVDTIRVKSNVLMVKDLEVNICQSCVSEMFRGFNKDK